MTEGRRRRVRKEEQVWVWSQWWRRAGVVEDTRLNTAGPGEESRLAWVLQGPCHGGPLAGRSVTCSGLSTVPLAATEPCHRGLGGGGCCCYDPGVRGGGLTPGSRDGDWRELF